MMTRITLALLAILLASCASPGRVEEAGESANCTSTIVGGQQQLTAAVEDLSPADVLCLEGTFDERILVAQSGTAEMPITIRSGNPDSPAVLDLGSVEVPEGDSGAVELRGIRHVRIEGLEITGWQTDQLGHAPAGILVTSEGDQHLQGISLTGNVINEVAHTHGTTFTEEELADCEGDEADCIGDGLAFDLNAFGIVVKGRSSQAITGLEISGNELSDLTLGASEALVVNGNVDSFLIAENRVHDVNNIAIDAIGFEDLDAYPAGFPESEAVARNGEIVGNRVWNVSSDGNPAYGTYEANGEVVAFDRSAVGIYVDGGRDNVIQANTVIRADIGIEIAAEYDLGATSGNIVRNNIVAQADFAAVAIGGYAAEEPDAGQTLEDSYNGQGDAVGTQLVNNTLYTADPGSALVTQFRVRDSVIVNNILAAPDGQAYVVTDPDSYDGQQFETNEETVVSGAGANPGDTFVSVDLPDGDELLSDGASTFLRLRPDAAAVDAGVRLTAAGTQVSSGEIDIDGEPREVGPIDIGADELRGEQASPNPTPSVPPEEPPNVQRVSESGPTGISVAVSQVVFADATSAEADGEPDRRHADLVVLGRDDAFPDSLAAGPLLAGGPLLYVPGGPDGSLPDVVRSELRRVLPEGGRVYIVGGTAAVSPDIQLALERLGFDVVRLGGSERTSTARLIADRVVEIHGAPTRVLLAAAGNWPDAVAGGSLAAASTPPTPILLTKLDALPAATADFLDTYGASQTTVLGGTAVINQEVQVLAAADRLAGPTRADTALAIEQVFPESATGASMIQGFVDDGWVEGNAAAAFGHPLLLNGPSPDSVNGPTTRALEGRDSLIVVGGPDRISDVGVVEAARALRADRAQ